MHNDDYLRMLKLIERHEGRVNKMYRCPAGYLTIGVGHNLEANPISNEAIDVILGDDVREVEHQLDRAFPWWRDHDPVRRAALVDLCFNMGIGTLQTFRNTLRAFEQRAYEAAAIGLRNSKWFTQVGNRGPRIVEMVRTGVWPN